MTRAALIAVVLALGAGGAQSWQRGDAALGMTSLAHATGTVSGIARYAERERGGRYGLPAPSSLTALRARIHNRRLASWRHQDALGLARFKTAYRERASRSVRYLVWLKRRWSLRADAHWRIWARLQWDSEAAICFVFRGRCGEALAVARCEAGSPPSRNATNGQYLGIFQMGSFARSTYGHSSTALGQARAAYRYFVDSGRDWSPWSCKPW